VNNYTINKVKKSMRDRIELSKKRIKELEKDMHECLEVLEKLGT